MEYTDTQPKAPVATEPQQAERPYGYLLGAGTVLLVISIIAGALCFFISILQFADPSTFEKGGYLIGIAVGLFLQGIILNSLIRLAVNVANDTHDGLTLLQDKVPTHTRLLAALANAASPVERE